MKIIDDSKIKYQYIELPSNLGTLTIASAILGSHSGIEYCAGIAYCSESDQFDKKIGKEIATERMYLNLYNNFTLPIDEDEIKFPILNTFNQIFILMDLERDMVPHRLRKMFDAATIIILKEFYNSRKNATL